jgi:glycosyltransferase involved in cell wall biosynthesis
MMKKLRVCLFVPWLKSRGGAEATILAFLKNTKHDVDIYTWIYDKENTFLEFKNYSVKIIAPPFIQSLSRSFLLRSLVLLFSKLPKGVLDYYDVLLLSTSGMAEIMLLRNKPKKAVLYCHTILRAANPEDVRWYLDNKYKNPISKLIYLTGVKIYNYLEKKSWKHIDKVIFNSELSQERAKRKELLGEISSQIVYPPVKLDKFSKKEYFKGKYFFYPSRFNPPKRQELLIEAWRIFQKKHPHEMLVLAGSTEKEDYFNYLKKKAQGLNIYFRPNITDDKMLEFYLHCKAGIFVSFVEDFGIVPFEFVSLGKPLIAVDRGGYIPLIKDYPLYFPIIERVDDYLMIQEINASLERFLNTKMQNRKEYKAKILSEEEFASEVDKCLMN